MRRLLALVAFVGVLAVLVSLAGSLKPANAAPAKLRCPGAGGKTVLRTPRVRIFTLRTDPDLPPEQPTYFGCLYRTGVAFRISLLDDYSLIVDDLRLAGRYVALAQNLGCGACGGDIGDRLVVRDLATGRASYVGPTFKVGDAYGDVTDIALKPNGSAAYVYLAAGASQVRVVTGQTDRIVDQGPDISPGSLELSPDGRTVTYLKASERRTVPLP